MDLRFSAADEAFRAEVRAWLAENVPAEPLPSGDTAAGFSLHVEWEKRLFSGGWSAVSWPVEYGGRGASLVQWLIFEEEYYRAGAPARVDHLRVRHRRAARPDPPTDGRRRAPLGAGLERARRRL
jgi:alkylation response protein AidB-like acyl-CoA dehydrogenase